MKSFLVIALVAVASTQIISSAYAAAPVILYGGVAKAGVSILQLLLLYEHPMVLYLLCVQAPNGAVLSSLYKHPMVLYSLQVPVLRSV
jgi:hypothetical protein